MKHSFAFLLFTLSSMSALGSCWDEANIKSKQDFARVREFQENRPKPPADYSNKAEVQAYQKANLDYRDKLRTMSEEAQAKSRQYSEECKGAASASRDNSNNCSANKEAQIKANWEQVKEFQKTRPVMPANFKTKEEFEAYNKSIDEFKAKAQHLTDQIKAKNKAIIDVKCY